MEAILSDIHGNLEALTAVLADIESRGVRRVVNLGDTFGYGPDQIECFDRACEMSVLLMGNFDQAVLYRPDGFPPSAEMSLRLANAQLTAEPDPTLRERRRKRLLDLRPSCQHRGVLYVHGSPRVHRNEYVFPEDVYNPKKMSRIDDCFRSLCFVGHTHVPGIFLRHGPEKWDFISPKECDGGFPVAGNKLICNVGSVGQPRDEDPRACYCLFDGERVWFIRVPYDIDATVRKIYATPELENFLGDRLREGR